MGGTTGKTGQFETSCYYNVLVYASPRSSWMWALQPSCRCDAPGFLDHFIRWQLKAADTASILLLSSSHPMDEPTSTQILQVSGRHALLIRLVLAVVMHWAFLSNAFKCIKPRIVFVYGCDVFLLSQTAVVAGDFANTRLTVVNLMGNYCSLRMIWVRCRTCPTPSPAQCARLQQALTQSPCDADVSHFHPCYRNRAACCAGIAHAQLALSWRLSERYHGRSFAWVVPSCTEVMPHCPRRSRMSCCFKFPEPNPNAA